MATAPFRGPPTFGLTETATSPVPVPLAAPATAIQSTRLVAFHTQPAIDETVTDTDPPSLVTPAVDRSRENRHGAPS
jgi:hypothetical protein